MPYYQPVAPEVPDAQKNKGPELILQGLHQGFAAMAEINRQRRESELAVEQMALKEKLAAEDHQLEREKNLMNFQLGQQENELKGVYYDSLLLNARTNAQRKVGSLRDLTEFNQQIASLKTDAESRAKELRLTDPEFQTKDPVGFAANLQNFRDEFDNAPTYTGIGETVKKWQKIADQQTVNLKFGAHPDPDNPDKFVGGGTGKNVPLWKVVKGLQDPDEYDSWKNALAASGHITSETKDVPTEGRTHDWRHPIDTLWDKFVKGAAPTKEVTSESYDPMASDIFGKAGAYDFTTRHASRLPAFVPKGSASSAAKTGQDIYDVDPNATSTPAGQLRDQGAIDQAVERMDTEDSIPPEVDTPALPDSSSAVPASATEPTDTDKIIAHAKNAIARGANPSTVAARLREMSIDPNQLLA